MPSLKDLRNRIDSVKSTKKITQAMKMVAASKLKKAQSLAEKSRSYSNGIKDIVKKLVHSEDYLEHPLIAEDKKDINNSLVLVVSSDRGLCGGLNTNIIKKTRGLVAKLESENKKVSIICLGKKGYDSLSVFNKENLDQDTKFINVSDIDYNSLQKVGSNIIENFYKDRFSECYILYNYFKSVISQEVKIDRLLPYEKLNFQISQEEESIFYDFEPEVEEVLAKILPKNFIVQIYKSVLESRASEQGARMTAMDNATRNAGDMIDSLSLKYNRQRQAMITKELIEIISGAEAL
jgi:F-type H+-transporting ATPase subunit gamma